MTLQGDARVLQSHRACVVALDDRFYHPGEFKRVDFSCNTQFGSYATEALSGSLDAELIDVGASAGSLRDVLDRIEVSAPSLLVIIPCGRYRDATYQLASNVIAASGCRLAILAGPCLPDDPTAILERVSLIDGVLLGDDFARVTALAAAMADGGPGWRERATALDGYAWRTSDGEIRVRDAVGPPAGLGPLSVRHRVGALQIVSDRAPTTPDRYGKWLIDSSIGCPRRCIYCRTPVISARTGDWTWRPRPAVEIVEEMAEVVAQTGTREFRFQDDNFLMPSDEALERAVAFSHEIAARDLDVSFQIMFHSSVVSGSTQPPLDRAFSALESSGLERVFLGIESGDPGTLEYFRKGADRRQNDQAIAYLAGRGLLVICGSVVFHPRTTLDQLARERAYFGGLVASLDVAALSPLGSYAHLIPMSELEEEVIAKGLGTSDEAEFRPADDAAARALEAMLVFRRYTFTHDWFVFTVKRDLRHWIATGIEPDHAADVRTELLAPVADAAVAGVDASWAVIERASEGGDWRSLIGPLAEDLHERAATLARAVDSSALSGAWRASLYRRPEVPSRWSR